MKPRSIQLNKLLEQGTRGNPLDRLTSLERDSAERFFNPLHVTRLGDISDDLGDVYGGRIILPSGDDGDPESPAFSGVFLAAIAQALSDGNFWLANVLLGAVQYGIGESGEFIRGATFLSNHYATVGAYDRRARRGFQEVDSKPAYLLEMFDNATGANLITSNPSFESGDFTGWTQTDSYAGLPSWVVLPGGVDASYYANISIPFLSGSGNATIICNKYATTARQRYTFNVSIGHDNLASVVIQAKWYDATPTLISTDTIYSHSSSVPYSESWSEKIVTFVAPLGSTQVEIRVYGTIGIAYVASANLRIDAVSIVQMTEYAAIQLDDDGVRAISESKAVNLLGFPQSAMQFSTQYVTSVTTTITNDANFRWGYFRAPSAANANDGDEYLYQFFLDAGTYTMYTYGATSQACGIVDYYLDGSGTAFSTGQDWYSAGAATRAEKSVASVVIPTGGRHTIKVKVNGKNASATDYVFANTAIWFNQATYTAEV